MQIDPHDDDDDPDEAAVNINNTIVIHKGSTIANFSIGLFTIVQRGEKTPKEQMCVFPIEKMENQQKRPEIPIRKRLVSALRCHKKPKMISGGKKKKKVSETNLPKFVPPVGATKMEIVKKTNYVDDRNTRGGCSRVVTRMN